MRKNINNLIKIQWVLGTVMKCIGLGIGVVGYLIGDRDHQSQSETETINRNYINNYDKYDAEPYQHQLLFLQ